MQTLDLNEEKPYKSDKSWAAPLGMASDAAVEAKSGFWRRQFQQEQTSAQKKFDWIFGVVLPVVCFFFDPIVFVSGGMEHLHDYKIGVYLLTYVSIMAMVAWLLWREKLKWLNAVLAGLFAAGALVALTIGIVIFPISLVGLIFLIGALGFTPLITSVIYARNSVRATRAARPFLEKYVLVHILAVSAIFSLVIPYVVNIAMTDRTSGFWRLMLTVYGWII